MSALYASLYSVFPSWLKLKMCARFLPSKQGGKTHITLINNVMTMTILIRIQFLYCRTRVYGMQNEVSFLFRFRLASNSRLASFGVGLNAQDMKLSHPQISILP